MRLCRPLPAALPRAVSSAAVDLAEKLNAKAIVAYTQTGNTVHRVSRERPAAPIYGLTTNEHTYTGWPSPGAPRPSCSMRTTTTRPARISMAFTDKVLKNAGKVSDGDKIVVLSSAQASTPLAAPTPSTCTPSVPTTDFSR